MFQNKNTVAAFIFGVSIVILVILWYLLESASKKNKGRATEVKSSARSLKGIFWMYKLFSQSPFFKRYFGKIKNHLEINYPADDMSVKRKATITMGKCVGAAIFVMILVCVMARGDFFFICMGIFLTYFLFTYLIGKFQERLDNKLLFQLGDFITNIRHHYSAQGNVEDSIYDTLDETPYEMGLHATKIYKILNSTNVENEVDKYTDIAPNRFMLTLVAICATIKEYGDKKLDNGQSLFLTNINYLKEEINVELIRRKRNNFLFSGLTTLSLLPLFFLKAIESFGISNIPEMESFYSGTAGTVVMAALFVITLIIYQLVTNLKDGHAEDIREHKIINRILSVAIINKFITIAINRDYTKHLRIDDGLKMVGDRIGIKGFLVKRILFGLIAVVIINLVIFTAEWRTRYNITNDFSDTFESSIVPNEQYRQTMKDIAKDYAVCLRTIEDTSENRDYIQAQIEAKGIRPTFAKEIVNTAFIRASQYNNVYYRWWFLIINILGFFFGYFFPWALLWYQLKIVKMDMEDEVIQYQTIVLILMHVDGIMIDTVLEWMERFSFCFKQSIGECILNLEYSTQKALSKMKNQETFAPFRRFVDNLLMVDDEDILTAFAEIETDREYYKEKRKADNEIISTQKAEIGKIIAFIPLIATLFGDLLIPFGVYAVKMLGVLSI